jgi:hypothetical protein
MVIVVGKILCLMEPKAKSWKGIHLYKVLELDTTSSGLPVFGSRLLGDWQILQSTACLSIKFFWRMPSKFVSAWDIIELWYNIVRILV